MHGFFYHFCLAMPWQKHSRIGYIVLQKRWAPLVDQETLSKIDKRPLGCSTEQPLPLPPRPKSGVEWLDTIYGRIDWIELSNRTASITGQCLV